MTDSEKRLGASSKRSLFCLVDRTNGRPLVDVAYPTEFAAEQERLSLLRPYPAGHEWRSRLVVEERHPDGRFTRLEPRDPTIMLADYERRAREESKKAREPIDDDDG